MNISAVLGLLSVSVTAAPTPLRRRDDDVAASQASCPGTLRAPSGSAYFAFNTNLNHQTAQEACASCYGGLLANVAAADLQFLAQNLEQASWIKSWNGDDYANTCLSLQPNGGVAPSFGVDAACSSEMWPLCVASVDQANGGEKVEATAVGTLHALAIPYRPNSWSPESVPEQVRVDPMVVADPIADVENFEGIVTVVIEGFMQPKTTGPPEPKITCSKPITVAAIVEDGYQVQPDTTDHADDAGACQTAEVAGDLAATSPADLADDDSALFALLTQSVSTDIPAPTGTVVPTDVPTATQGANPPASSGVPAPSDTGVPTATQGFAALGGMPSASSGIPAPSDTGVPAPSNTGVPAPSDTGVPAPSNTAVPTATQGFAALGGMPSASSGIPAPSDTG
ncbi:hypothetical protein BGX28_010422, partial [Mortierella sp. GBA30]